MTGTQITIIVVVAIGGYFGFNSYDRYLQAQEHMATLHSDNEDKVQLAELGKKIADIAIRSQELYVEQIKTYDNVDRITNQP